MGEKSMRDIFRLGFREEVTNCVIHGIMAFLCVCSLPVAAVYSYNKSGNKLATGVLVFILCLLLMFLASTLYHHMSFGITYKYISRKLDHICIYFAIAGGYIPVVLTLIGGQWNYLILAIGWSTVLGGVPLKAISPKNYPKLSIAVYMVIGWTAIFFPPTLLSKINPLFPVLIVDGGVMCTIGAFFYGKPQKKYFHSIQRVYINLASALHLTVIVLVM